MRPRRFLRVARFILFAVVAGLVLSFVAMRLWNWLMPPVFGLHLISFSQALGLLVLSRVLLGGFRGRWGWGGMHWRGRMMERWAQMTPEERENFRAGMRGRCGPFAPPSPEPKA